jgi:hypothetical protein
MGRKNGYGGLKNRKMALHLLEGKRLAVEMIEILKKCIALRSFGYLVRMGRF